MKRPYTVLLIVPTGIGAAIGGYAGDALPVARAISQVADCLITHPNVLNGAQLYWNLPNALYVEGYGLDQVAAGRWGLRPVHQNRVGLVLDQGIEPDLRLRQLQAADATRATLGLNLTEYIVTDTPLNVSLKTAASGATWGTIEHPDSLLRAVDQLIHQAGAQAIAVVARFPDDPGSTALQQYRQGQGVDPLAGAEAVISHLVVRTFQIPCAHAPALSPLPLDRSVSPRSAAEELGYTFLPCVLVGLSQAPQFVTARSLPQVGDVWADQIDAVILPATACGGSAVLSLSHSSTRIITVAENTTTLHVTPERLNISALQVQSYVEALGVLVCDRAGISAAALHPNVTAVQGLVDW
ncbi:DUF3326 domain-containing protein [Pantanalinema sp. GBBB05]|uniref:DUF3326 domain-containing protein n=1 Tax=Pantanalinema sp. GBBB05 TaxID=2604139 RepID=UPI001E04AE68|nr:DUF3326 domain-containing protein [Pantanalinema sp. GBBB05]